ncbi:hypothetical protein RRG08_013454 [Elysia crispata]|uniref:Uncharacterized protein n=1 Tax=Elysia crispata TaxID=231223 RepID=A0AAE1EB20_9GAST|nr:hypothetical protein RRG08_013454 [Elysia crispata]
MRIKKEYGGAYKSRLVCKHLGRIHGDQCSKHILTDECLEVSSCGRSRSTITTQFQCDLVREAIRPTNTPRSTPSPPDWLREFTLEWNKAAGQAHRHSGPHTAGGMVQVRVFLLHCSFLSEEK